MLILLALCCFLLSLKLLSAGYTVFALIWVAFSIVLLYISGARRAGSGGVALDL